MLGSRISIITFVISLIGHCLFLSMPGFNPSLSQTERCEEIAVEVEIDKPPLLPDIDVMGDEKKLKEVIEPAEPEPQPEPEMEPESEPEPELELEEMEMVEEEVDPVISNGVEVMNPEEEAMLRYQDMVKQRIEGVRRYPSWAKKHRVEGDACIKFTVLSNGLSQDVEIIHSSGSKILDEEAVDTIKRASPFPPIPEEIDSSLVRMEVSIVFTLKYE